MWITRKQRDCGFPAAVTLGGRDRFWRVDELDAWDRRMIEAGPPLLHGVTKRRA
jgi:predicted DNA-binding transcriptional regulator AlpA